MNATKPNNRDNDDDDPATRGRRLGDSWPGGCGPRWWQRRCADDDQAEFPRDLAQRHPACQSFAPHQGARGDAAILEGVGKPGRFDRALLLVLGICVVPLGRHIFLRFVNFGQLLNFILDRQRRMLSQARVSQTRRALDRQVVLDQRRGYRRRPPVAKNITLFPSAITTQQRGYTSSATVNINAHCRGRIPLPPVYPMGNANPVYGKNPLRLFKQSQLSANMQRARLNARYLDVRLTTVWGNAHSNTDGVNNAFPANTYDLSTEWSRARFDVRHRAVMGGSLTAPFGIRLNPFLLFASAAPSISCRIRI